MKRLVLVLVLCVLVGFTVSAQTAQGPKMAVGWNPVAIIWDEFDVSFEYAFTTNMTAKGMLSYSPNLAWLSGMTLFGFQAEFRYYFFGGAVGGFYAGAGGGFNVIGGSFDLLGVTVTYSGFLPDIFAEIGYKWVVGKTGGFYLEPFFGYELAFGTVSVTVSGGTFTGVSPAVGGILYGLNLGWAFGGPSASGGGSR